MKNKIIEELEYVLLEIFINLGAPSKKGRKFANKPLQEVYIRVLSYKLYMENQETLTAMNQKNELTKILNTCLVQW